ncbi:family 16 glycosylhydrolase [Vibrio sp. D420a]|uniref:family 16 glycosylhydrolase n=1 Tax=Vibrio TaxID=662 RepID=UPI002554AA12|nr:family 16 glycosylhydrolase [Vibrio sp. D420a]MDK9760721.1 family 16 glycosylhydrolase [Vibrio sp. D420a]
MLLPKTYCALAVSLALTSSFVSAESFEDPLRTFDESRWWLSDGWENGFPFLSRWDAKSATFNKKGLTLTLAPDDERDADGKLTFYGGELRSHEFFPYGCYEIDMKPARAPGVVSSFFLFSGPYDKPEGGSGKHNEIDIEFLGSNTNMVQLNFWTDDDSYTNSHETLIFLGFDASKAFHRYGIYWGEDRIEWFIDGQLVLRVNNSPYDPTPSTESSYLRVMANIWATDPEIANWAGKFREDKVREYRAKYRNFSFKENERCTTK